jgi:hypothetical protein
MKRVPAGSVLALVAEADKHLARARAAGDEAGFSGRAQRKSFACLANSHGMPEQTSSHPDVPAPERPLMAEIEQTIADYQKRFAEMAQTPPGSDGYSSKMLTTYAALQVECASRFDAFAARARAFDTATPGAASAFLQPIVNDLRAKIKESIYVAAFKVVREDLHDCIADLRVSAPANANSMDLYTVLSQLQRLEERIAAFEPRARELEAEGSASLRTWLTSSTQLVSQQLATIQKRIAEYGPPAPVPAPPATAPPTYTPQASAPAQAPSGISAAQLQAAAESQAAYQRESFRIAAETRQDILDTMQRMHERQVAMDADIAKMDRY